MTDLTTRLAALREKGVGLPEMWDRATLGIGLYPSELEALTVIERQQEEIDAARLELKTQEGVAKFWINAVAGPNAIIANALLNLAEQDRDAAIDVLSAVIRARDLAEQRIAELSDQIERWRSVTKSTSVELQREAKKRRAAHRRAEKAEARVEKAEAEVFEVLKRVDVTERRAEQAEAALAASETEVGRLQFVLSATEEDLNDAADALAAERAKRCATCTSGGWRTFSQTRICPIREAAEAGGVADDFGCTEWQPRNQVPNVAQQGSERDAEGTGEVADGNA